MRDDLSMGPTPCDESCASVGDLDYSRKARAACIRFIQLLHKKFGPEPEGAWLSGKWVPHDFGSECEVVCSYHPGSSASADNAFRCDAETPATWEDVCVKKSNAHRVAQCSKFFCFSASPQTATSVSNATSTTPKICNR
jgi:hypothetical protein